MAKKQNEKIGVEREVVFVMEDGTKTRPMKAIVTPNPYYSGNSKKDIIDK